MEKKIDMKPKTQAPETDPKYKIGFGKGVRVGNFRLYKIRASVGAKQHVDAIIAASLNQTWKVQIPSTTPMFAWIELLYKDYVDGKQDGLNMVLSNMMNASLTPRADYHYLMNCIAQIFADPNGKFKKDGKEYTFIEAVCNDVRWIGEKLQSEYEADRKAEEESPEAEEQLKRDETYHSMLDEMERLKKSEEKDGDSK